MYGFLFFYLVAAAAADNLGYNYQPLGHDAPIGGVLHGSAIANGANSYTAGGAAATANGGFGGFAGVNDAGNYADSSSGTGLGPQSSGHVEYNKEFYTYAAPEHEFEENIGADQIGGSLKKNLRVVFIKAPENQGLSNAVLQLAKQAAEQRTAIYVLSKQPDVSELANKLQALQGGQTHAPEVHFVKYRTPEDAAHAQHAIQAQYESLGGQSQHSNEGVAPVLDFASPAAAPLSNSQSDAEPSVAYLPPN
ncbi:uncharacterized protein LOC105220371 [Zeugodacus cucurbitae]|uniref:uncharacterized protein LOC105220371 n=1 Tax=Zeugodacus cucurbitae TaxID=28588 RepID=UPI0023D95D26|nr:uncharacterized protein LOC105220371 [Zeugodacus cucurbitae]